MHVPHYDTLRWGGHSSGELWDTVSDSYTCTHISDGWTCIEEPSRPQVPLQWRHNKGDKRGRCRVHSGRYPSVSSATRINNTHCAESGDHTPGKEEKVVLLLVLSFHYAGS